MNKITIALIFMLGIPAIGHAINNPRRVICYEAEGSVYYELEGFVPSSTIAFYSETSGGRCLQTNSIDGVGRLQIQADPKFKPSFVLNTKSPQGNSGDGMVTFIGEKEFHICNISVEQKNNSVTLNWDAAVSHTGDYEFIILHSSDNITYTQLTTVQVNSATLYTYHYTDLHQSDGITYYKVQVRSTKSDINYTSGALPAGGKNLKLYPTVAEDCIHVIYNGNINQARYLIADLQGKVVARGNLTATTTIVPIETLTAGNYLLHLESPNEKQAKLARFIKK